MADDRLDRLERRLAALEQIVRQLAQRADLASDASPPRPTPPPAPTARPSAGGGGPTPASTPVGPRPRRSFPIALPDLERWAGLRGLLAVGVVALIVAAGYLLKLAFDEGWISPVVRSVGGVVVGLIVGGLGFRLEGRGLRTYGASLIGTGAAIIYLSLWAAVALYGLVAPFTGLAGLALVSASVALVAAALDVEALGVAAALGLLVAPGVVGQRGHADALLAFLAITSGGLAFLALRQRLWRSATMVVAAGYFGLAAFRAASDATPLALVAYSAIGGALGLRTGLRQRWWETRLLAFVGAWTLLFVAADRLHPVAWAVVGGLVLAVPIWQTGLEHAARWPVAAGATALGEVLYFFLTPWFVSLLLLNAVSTSFAWRDGVVGAAIAIPYLIGGYPRGRLAFLTVGAAALALGILAQFEGVAAVWLLLLVGLAWAGADHARHRLDGRWMALGTVGVAALRLLGPEEAQRRVGGAFVDGWALALWGLSGAITILAAGGWRRDADRPDRMPMVLWSAAGAFLFGGVSLELVRWFHARALAPLTADLASGLAVSAWWLLFAAGLVVAGFRLARRPLRGVGITIVFLTLGKVALWDLASLEALYRVGSVFLLGLVSLFLAYLYHRADRAGRTTGDQAPTATPADIDGTA